MIYSSYKLIFIMRKSEVIVQERSREECILH
jgi:hypothetical protein